MGFLDTVQTRIKKGTKKVVDTTTKVGNYMEDTSAKLVDKVPGGDALKAKAATYTEQAVKRVGTETKEMIKEGHEFVDAHMKKKDEAGSKDTANHQEDKKEIEKENTKHE